MKSLRYIRDLMFGRLASEAAKPRDESKSGDDAFGGDGDRRRFRRMAETRKRQILERMLLDDSRIPIQIPIPIPISFDDEQGRRR